MTVLLPIGQSLKVVAITGNKIDLFLSPSFCQLFSKLCISFPLFWLLDKQHNGQVHGEHYKHLYGAVPYRGLLTYYSFLCSPGESFLSYFN